jgi:hypothetical protein
MFSVQFVIAMKAAIRVVDFPGYRPAVAKTGLHRGMRYQSGMTQV